MAKSQFTKRKIKFFVIILILVANLAFAAGVCNHFYFGHYVKASDISDSLTDQLSVGSSFTIKDILKIEKYSYGWMKSDVNVEILVNNPNYDENKSDSKEEKYIVSKDILSYNAKTRTFKVCGIGAGIIDFKNPLDSSINLQVPFKTKFAIEDTGIILKDNYSKFFDDNLITQGEIASVEELRITTSRSYDVGEFYIFPNLCRVVLSSENVLQLGRLANLDKNIIFYVKDGLYDEYMSSSHWAKYRERIFPIVDLSAGKHTLVFELRGGYMAAAGTDGTRYFSSVEDGETINLNEFVAKRTGYTFLGWYTSNDNGNTLNPTRIQDDYVFLADTKLYADWSANEYEIIYHDDYVTELPESQKIKYDQQSLISDIILERIGFTFMGWSLTEGATTVDFTPGKSIMNLATEDGAQINLYAVWATNAYTIIYDGNGSGVTNIPTRQSDIPFDLEISISDMIPIWKGYTFIGWSTNKSATDYEYEPGQKVSNLVADSNGEVVLYAIWSANTYSIYYDANGGLDAPTMQENLTYGEDVQLSSEVPSWTGHVFLGWSRNPDSSNASYSAGSIVSNLVSDAGGIVTLYAIWTIDSFRIEYDANGGTDAPDSSSYIYYNSDATRITSGKPNRIGYTFIGWSYSSTGDVDFISDQELNQAEINEMYFRASEASKVIVLYACWSINSYKITVKSSGEKGGSISGVTSGAYYQYNTPINIQIKYNGSKDRYIKIDGDKLGEKSTYSFDMPDHDVTIEVHSDPNCVATGTLITTADMQQVPIEKLKVGDKILAWDFRSQSFVETEILILTYHGDSENGVVNLQFSDGSMLRTIGDHVLFDMSQKNYITINCDNYIDFIGHEFLCYDGLRNQYATTKLMRGSVTNEVTGSYSIVTAYYFNYISDNVVTTSPLVPGLYELISSYIEDDFTFNNDEFVTDVETYGLYDYDLFKEYMTYEQFIKTLGPYFKLAVAKGFTTWEIILAVVTGNSQAYR